MITPDNQVKAHIKPSAEMHADIARKYGSKLEQRYAGHLQKRLYAGDISDWAHERMKFRIGKRCWYTPDFMVIAADGVMELHEVKGWARDDAKVKFRAAAEFMPYFRWFWVTEEGGAWKVEEYGK